VFKKLIKNSQPFGKKFQKAAGGGFFLTHTVCDHNPPTSQTDGHADRPRRIDDMRSQDRALCTIVHRATRGKNCGQNLL